MCRCANRDSSPPLDRGPGDDCRTHRGEAAAVLSIPGRCANAQRVGIDSADIAVHRRSLCFFCCAAEQELVVPATVDAQSGSR